MEDRDEVSEFLEHYGVKGMRWGVRRTQKQLDRAAGRKSDDDGGDKKSSSDSGKRSDASGRRSASSMTDKELKDVINRMQMERQYASLQPKTFSQKATKFLGEIAVNMARTQITQAGNNALNKQVGNLMKSRASRNVPPPPNRFPTAAPRAEDRVG